MSSRPKAIDLFSGCGGLTLGLRLAGFRVLGAVEVNDLAVETYRRNHRGVKVWHSDIRDLPVASVLRHYRLRRGELDLLAGCPPCQGFSTLTTLNGHIRKSDPRNELVHEFLRFVRGLRPKSLMMENVPGLVANPVLATILQSLKKWGYVTQYGILNAADYGVPQNRRRFILIANRLIANSSGELKFASAAKSRQTVRKALANLENFTEGDDLHNIPETRSKRVAAIIRQIPKDGGSRSALSRRFSLACHKDFEGFRDVYGRMSWDRPAPTITGGCCNPSKGRFLHPRKNRCITLREAAILQSFPPSYFFSLKRGKFATAQMIGNALPPEFIRRQAASLRASLEAIRPPYGQA